MAGIGPMRSVECAAADGRAAPATVSYQAPFDLLLNAGEFEYEAVVAPTGFEPALPP